MVWKIVELVLFRKTELNKCILCFNSVLPYWHLDIIVSILKQLEILFDCVHSYHWLLITVYGEIELLMDMVKLEENFLERFGYIQT